MFSLMLQHNLFIVLQRNMFTVFEHHLFTVVENKLFALTEHNRFTVTGPNFFTGSGTPQVHSPEEPFVLTVEILKTYLIKEKLNHKRNTFKFF